MASEARVRALVPAIVAGIAALAFGAGLLHASPRLAVLCALAALPLVAALWSTLRRPGAPDEAAAASPPALRPDQQRLLDDALLLEARLAHAPIALFGIEGDGVTPLNASARRLVAPGRASEPADLYRQLTAQPDGRRALLHFETERGAERALVAVAGVSVHGRTQRLAALMPVESELEAEALNAWRQLVHVLTHEIMNSLTPVASLSRTAIDLLEELRPGLPPEAGTDLATALDAIGRRAASLADFVASYRSLSNVPPARPERVRVTALFERVAALVAPAWRARGGAVHVAVEPASLELIADPGQLEQALINLLKNAFEATATLAGAAGGQAWLGARLVRGGRLCIEVLDDGPGVPPELAAHIFTPFYTTKKQGGGIGLAMVRHLVHANGGTVRHARSVGKGARFLVTF